MTKSSNRNRRALPREVRQGQLIDATIRCIARQGLSGVTMAAVTREAGLSLGIANLHFQSKDKLLLATLKQVTAEYSRGQDAILDSDDFPSTAAKIEALLDFDFSPAVTDRNKLAVWYAFMGEARSRPTYRRICSRQDSESEKKVAALFQLAIAEGDYPHTDAALLSSSYIALIDGLWLNALVAPRRLTWKKARSAARHYLANAFPRHIDPET